MKTQQNDSVESPHNTTDTTNGQARSRAQRKVLSRLAEAHAVSYEKRNYGTFRFHGRGMARTLASLEKQGLITFDTVNSLTGDHFYAYLKGVKLQ